MSEDHWLLGLRAAGVFHFITVGLAIRTPIPRDWDAGLAALSPVHRRFAIAQNAAVGAVMLFFGYVSLFHAPALLEGSAASRLLAAAIALWWGGRLLLLPWLCVGPELTTPRLRIGFTLLRLQCAIYGAAYGWLAFAGASTPS
jgi:hypothetical protein